MASTGRFIEVSTSADARGKTGNSSFDDGARPDGWQLHERPRVRCTAATQAGAARQKRRTKKTPYCRGQGARKARSLSGGAIHTAFEFLFALCQ